MASSTYERTKVFISYSHQDKRYLDELRKYLKYYERKGDIEYWDDTKITPGSRWYTGIKKAIETAKIVILLISPDFLASDFIAKNELPILLEDAKHDKATILPVL